MRGAREGTIKGVMRGAGLLAFAALLAGISSFPARAADESFERTVTLAPGGSFSLQNVDGPVSVTGWDRDTVEVRAVKTANQPGADLSRVQINVAAAPGAVSVTTVYPQGEEESGVAVAYSVEVPRAALLQHIATVNGTLHVSGVQGAGELHSVNGNIEVSDSAGGLSARTTNGDIHMAFAKLDAPRPLTVETVNGSIVLALPSDASALLDARNLNGNFRSELPLLVTGAYGSREVQGRLGSGSVPVPVLLHTVNGAIRVVALPKRT
jgi:hypothetical protein